jgi:peroxiredoxin Q/BCP
VVREGRDVQVVDVGRADSRTDDRFVERLGLGYPLFIDRDGEITDRYGVSYRVPRAEPTAVRSCFLVDANREIRYRWIGSHRSDPAGAPPLSEMYEAIRREVGAPTETFGLVRPAPG